MGDKTEKTESKGSPGKNTKMTVIQGKMRKKQYKLTIWQKTLYIIYFVGMFLILMYFLLKLWPLQVEPLEGASSTPKVHTVKLFFGLVSLKITDEVRFILITAIMGALGGCAFGANAFAYHMGRKKFEVSFTCWYILRPVLGSILAIIFYFAFRAAFFSLSADTGDLNVFGIATLGGIVGLFSKETIEKLDELFENILPTNKDEKGTEKKEKEKPEEDQNE